ncbi:MAG: hypothetical protein ACOX3T_03255 [Bdellovibrionota bacterium]
MQAIFVSGAYAEADNTKLFKREKLDKSYVKLIKQFCKEIKKDGRAWRVSEIASSNFDRRSPCSLCNDFFLKTRIFCQMGEVAKKKNRVQREPSLTAIYTTINLFNKLASDEKIYDSATKISMMLSYSLKNSSQMSKGEKEYFDMLSQYIKEPFMRRFGGVQSVAETAKGDEKNKARIFEDLFGN